MPAFISKASAFLIAALLWSPSVAMADCDYEVGFYVDDVELLRTLRCLNTEIERLKRNQAVLDRKLKSFERLMAELPTDYANRDGVVTEEPGRPIGRASFLLTARATGSASVLPIEQRVLEEVCGKAGGCTLSITFRQFSIFDGAATETILTGPCQFSYTPQTGAWGLGEACESGGATSGVDGDQRAVGSGEGDVIAVSGGACVLAESDLARATEGDTLARDGSRGIFLLSIPSLQPDGVRRFECELALD